MENKLNGEQITITRDAAKSKEINIVTREELMAFIDNANFPSTMQTTQFEVIKSWKGDLGQAVKMEINVACCFCSYEFKQGETYLVYANGPQDNGTYDTSSCSRTALSEDATADITILENMVLKPANSSKPEPLRRIERKAP